MYKYTIASFINCEAYKKYSDKLFSPACCTRTRCNNFIVKEHRCRLVISKKCFYSKHGKELQFYCHWVYLDCSLFSEVVLEKWVCDKLQIYIAYTVYLSKIHIWVTDVAAITYNVCLCIQTFLDMVMLVPTWSVS